MEQPRRKRQTRGRQGQTRGQDPFKVGRRRTGFMGKWHLGTETYYYPEHQGFDVNVAARDYGAPGSYLYPFRGSRTETSLFGS